MMDVIGKFYLVYELSKDFLERSKYIATFRAANFTFFLHPLFLAGCGGNRSRLSCHIF